MPCLGHLGEMAGLDKARRILEHAALHLHWQDGWSWGRHREQAQGMPCQVYLGGLADMG